MSNENIANCAVVIPIYKSNISANEEKSLRQCLNVLGEYPIAFIAPRKLNCDSYKQICSDYKASVSYETFKDKFFNDFNGYNALLVSGDFYKSFLNYKYILIYQLDAFVFKNDLTLWCERDYDYVGGPYFDLQRGIGFPKHTEFFNGGFSLRKTDTFYRLAKGKLRLNYFFYLLWSKYDALVKKRTVYSLIKLVFFYSWIRFFHKFLTTEFGEDFVWTSIIRKYGTIAPFDEALRFSFDSCPEYAFKLNNCLLPFGCHGWVAYYNQMFWKKFI